MATRQDRLRRLAHRIRNIPGKFGVRPYRVFVISQTHPGEHPGDGPSEETLTEVVEKGGNPPKVRYLSDEERALGNLSAAVMEIGPITPDHPGGGTTWSLLNGQSLTDGQVLHYELTGPEFPDGARFERVGGRDDRGYHFKIRVQPLKTNTASSTR